MKWFWRWVDNKIDRSRDYINHAVEMETVRSPGLSSDCFRFNLYNGNGGFIVEVSRTERSAYVSSSKALQDPGIGLYIIQADQDLGRELAKIVTMETCRR